MLNTTILTAILTQHYSVKSIFILRSLTIAWTSLPVYDALSWTNTLESRFFIPCIMPEHCVRKKERLGAGDG